MSNNNPFDNSYIDDDKTILRPMPGGRKPQTSSSPPPTPPTSPVNNISISETVREQIATGSQNPITGAAIALLSVVAQLRNTASHPDVAGLRASLVEEIKRFEITIKNQGVSAEQAQAARYALCTLLDETVLNTPWGSNSVWSTQSLLIFFHKEAWGGEKFFLILKNCMQQPGTHLNLLELLYFTLCLGFQGRYRVEDHGASKLEEIRENAYQIIQRQRGDIERSLPLHWQGIKDKRNVLAKLVPVWVIASVASLLLMLSFLGFLLLINAASDPLFGKLYALKDSFNVAAPVTVAQVAAPTPTTPTVSQLDEIATFLKPEIDHHEVEVLKLNGSTVVRIISKGFFATGSDKIMPQYDDLLNRIAQALSKVSNRVTVVGHTDSDRMISAKFPSNWDLSKARAVSVADRLSNSNTMVAPVVSEGRADTQPLVANDSPEHKAMNRRVEIILSPQG
jgi:type VI secretion system protein ImpK